MFQGAATALITPFTDNGVDFDALQRLLESQLRGNIDALLVCGTTGEPPTMTQQERESVIAFCIDYVNHRVPVFIGTGSNCTATAVQNSIAAQKAGADGLLVVTPYYNKCTQDGLVLHYRAVCESVDIPVIAYNIPGRTGVNILPETAARLAELPNLRGLKEACGKLDQIARTAELLKGSQVSLYSGDDALATQIIAMGGQGVISVASNLIPDAMHRMAMAAVQGDTATAEQLNAKYSELFRELFCEVNPIPVKYACSLMGLCRNIVRMPLTPVSEAGAQRVRHAMQACGIL